MAVMSEMVVAVMRRDRQMLALAHSQGRQGGEGCPAE